MKRLGLYTGRIYNQSDVGQIRECSVALKDGDAEDESYISDRYDLLHTSWCSKCGFCFEARQHIQKEEVKE